MKKLITVMTAALVLSAQTVNAQNVVTDLDVKSNPAEWGTNVFGDWSFWSVPESER